MSLASRFACAALLLLAQVCAAAADDAGRLLALATEVPGSFAADSASDIASAPLGADGSKDTPATPDLHDADDDGQGPPSVPRSGDDPPHHQAPNASPVPEPGTAGMLAAGVLMVAALARWRRRAA